MDKILEKIITPDWVQKGELGLAFVIVILVAWLILYVMRTSRAREEKSYEREDKLMNLLLEMQPALSKIADEMERIDRRLSQIENKKIKTRRHKRK